MAWWRKVQPGDKLQIPAAAYNAFIDAATKPGGADTTPAQDARPPGLVQVRNDSGKNLLQFHVLGLETQVYSTKAPPVGSGWEFRANPLFSGVIPRAPDHWGKFCVVQQPLKAGEVGWGMVSGVTPVRTTMRARRLEAQWADIEPGMYQRLEQYNSGSAKVLWTEHLEGGNRWTVCHLGAGPAMTFWARITAQSEIGPNRWAYTFSEISFKDPNTVQIPYLAFTGTAYNVAEYENNGKGREATGWDVDELSRLYYACYLGQTWPGGTRAAKLAPIPINTVVEIHRHYYRDTALALQEIYLFRATNAFTFEEPSASSGSQSASASAASGSGTPGCDELEVVTNVTFDPVTCAISLTKQKISIRDGVPAFRGC